MDGEANDAIVVTLVHDRENRMRCHVEWRGRGARVTLLSTASVPIDLTEWRKDKLAANDDEASVRLLGRNLFDSIFAHQPELIRSIGAASALAGIATVRGTAITEDPDSIFTIAFVGPEWLLEVPLEYIAPGFSAPWVQRFRVVRHLPGIQWLSDGAARSAAPTPGGKILLIGMNGRRETADEIGSLVSEFHESSSLRHLHVAHVEPFPFRRSLLGMLRTLGTMRPEHVLLGDWPDYDVVVTVGKDSSDTIEALGNLGVEARTRLFVLSGGIDSLLRNGRRLLVRRPRDVLAFRGAASQSVVSVLTEILRDGRAPAQAVLRVRRRADARWWSPVLLSNHEGNDGPAAIPRTGHMDRGHRGVLEPATHERPQRSNPRK